MTNEEFIANCLKTESKDFDAIIERISDIRTLRLLHAAIGLTTEAVEMLDAMKKFIFYGKKLDVVNIKEELGDSDWYKSIAIDELGSSFEEIQELVINKLKARYGGRFNEDGAINRNLVEERKILERKETQELYDELKDVNTSQIDMGFKGIKYVKY